MSSPRSSALWDVFNVSHTVIIERLSACTGGVQTAQIYHYEKKKKKCVKCKNENNNHCVLNPLIYKITSIIWMPSLFILVFFYVYVLKKTIALL